MKRKIAILLASIMTVAVPMSAMAVTSKAPSLIGIAPTAKTDKVIQTQADVDSSTVPYAPKPDKELPTVAPTLPTDPGPTAPVVNPAPTKPVVANFDTDGTPGLSPEENLAYLTAVETYDAAMLVYEAEVKALADYTAAKAAYDKAVIENAEYLALKAEWDAYNAYIAAQGQGNADPYLPAIVAGDLTKSINNILEREAVIKIGFDKDEAAAITYGTEFFVTVENGTLPATNEDVVKYMGYKNVTATGAQATVPTSSASLSNYFESILDTDAAGSTKLLGNVPYSIERISSTQAKITILASISNADLKDYKNSTITTVSEGDIALAIPFGAVTPEGEGDVKVTVDPMGNNKIKGGTTVIAKGIDADSKTELKLSGDAKTFDDRVTINNLLLSETVSGSFMDGKTINLRLSGGFKFVDNSNNNIGTVEGAANNNMAEKNLTIDTDNDSRASFVMSGTEGGNTLESLLLEMITIAPRNEKNFGDVELTISGEGVSEQTIKVATREILGFKLETGDEVPEIVAGRYWEFDQANMTSKDNRTVEVKFSEKVSNSLVPTRNLDFTVPDGVKIAAVKNISDKNLANLDANDFEIINGGETLRLKRTSTTGSGAEWGIINQSNISEIDMTLELSIDPDFTGDIEFNVEGGGQAAGTTDGLIVAKAIAPFKVETKTTKLNLGYQEYNTADIVITETKPGMFLEGKDATLAIKAPYGTGEIGFSDADYKVSGGELEIKDKSFDVEDGAITFNIERGSYKNPSTVTIENVTLGSTRSVPFGSYDLTLGGLAVVNNYQKDIKNDVSVGISGDVNTKKQNDSDVYTVDEYAEVITATGTLDEVVRVTIGEKTVLVGDTAYDMDVAPYIQAKTNSTMVPLRFVSLALGVDMNSLEAADETSKISFDANSKTATIYYGAGSGQKIIQFQAGSNIMTVDGTKVPMEYGVVAEIKDDRMFVPFRALGQGLGINVTWDADTKTAIYNAQNSASQTIETTTETTTEEETETTTKE